MSIRLLGHADVDAGMLMITDPCYWVDDHPETSSEDWHAFLEAQFGTHTPDGYDPKVRHATGNTGKGVVAATAHGDGSYPVYGLMDDEDPARARVMFVVTDDLGEQDIDEIVALLRKKVGA